MLLGEFHCVTDGEGQLTIPPELCAELAEGATLTRGIERCLFVYPAEAWQNLVGKMERRLPLTNRDARSFARLMFSGAIVCAPNRRGQISLSDSLRRYAGIEREAIVVGLCTHLEIWSPQRWGDVMSRLTEGGTAVAESLGHLGV